MFSNSDVCEEKILILASLFIILLHLIMDFYPKSIFFSLLFWHVHSPLLREGHLALPAPPSPPTNHPSPLKTPPPGPGRGPIRLLGC